MNRPYSFLVLTSFEATVNGCLNQYHAGHRYTVREGKPWDDLDSRVAGWISEGKAAY